MADCRLKKNKNLSSCKKDSGKGLGFGCSNVSNSDIKKLVNNSMLEIHVLSGRTTVGLARGESKRLTQIGIPRKKQIEVIDCLQDNPKVRKKFLGEN